MKSNLFVLSSIVIAIGCFSFNNSSYNLPETIHTIAGTLTSSSSYCGGAAPTPEMLENHHKQRPYSTWLYLKEGKYNNPYKPIIDSVQTNSVGYFEFHVTPGDYVIITPNQRDESFIERIQLMVNDHIEVDSVCLNNWYKQGLFQIYVKDSSITTLNHNFHSRCFVPYPIPCIQYTGPYPP